MDMIKNITNVRGIKCWGAHTGVKSMRRDLAIIYSEVPASAAAVFTQNQVVAEPLKVTRRHIADGRAQAIVINAGNANACTGEQGRLGAEAMAQTMAGELELDPDLILVASTGLIGEPFPTEEIVNGIRENVKKLSSKSNAGSFVANAILTTDTFPKEGFIGIRSGRLRGEYGRGGQRLRHDPSQHGHHAGLHPHGCRNRTGASETDGERDRGCLVQHDYR